MLELKNIKVETEGKKVLENISLKIEKPGVYAIMGKNGSGKTTLAQTIMGNPKYKIVSGNILLDEENITRLGMAERTGKGLFVSYQNPVEIPGVSIYNFLRNSYNSLNKKKLSLLEFGNLLNEKTKEVGLGEQFLLRNVNENFSGGEKKKSEILQVLVLNPNLIILDEIDSGLDIDSIKKISEIISKLKEEGKTIILITHYKKILDYLKPEKVFIIDAGKIIKEGDSKLIEKLEKGGYGSID